MPEAVIIDAVGTSVGKPDGALATVHLAVLLGRALTALIERTGVDPAAIDDVVAGCVSQVGQQSFNIGRTAWLAAGLPMMAAWAPEA
jgi:acetyl-CoA acetyltransferase